MAELALARPFKGAPKETPGFEEMGGFWYYSICF
jgi:hypothetical protein